MAGVVPEMLKAKVRVISRMMRRRHIEIMHLWSSIMLAKEQRVYESKCVTLCP